MYVRVSPEDPPIHNRCGPVFPDTVVVAAAAIMVVQRYNQLE
jgi:hypothetical protein